MEQKDLTEKLLKCRVTQLTTETRNGTFSTTNRNSLTAQQVSNRSSADWKKAQFVIINKDNDNSTNLKDCLNGWKSLAKEGQFLIIYENNEWLFFDYLSKMITWDTMLKYTPFPNNIRQENYHITPLQIIYYGAPGTGKSNKIKTLTGDGTFTKDFTFRITFHPDSDYATFVGAYKPIWNGDKIIYDFRPQAFLKAYIAAWSHPDNNVALVIEEINRGNCAQIFGDIFQLLDREKSGLSKYPIEADLDMKDFLKKAFNDELKDTPWAGNIPDDKKDTIDEYYAQHYDNAFDKIKNGDILALPMNLSLLATMNTSDQSLFPMDSAFKRRWDWEYIKIENAGKDWKIRVSDEYELIDWWEFLERINKVIADLTTSEDKQLGYFFCMPDKKANENDSDLTIISDETFVGKVIFYLWNDVFKDYAFDAPCCKDKNEKEVLYAKFYKGDSINRDTLVQFFDKLKDGNEDSLLKIKTKETIETDSVVETDQEAIPNEETTATEGEAESAEVTSSTPTE